MSSKYFKKSTLSNNSKLYQGHTQLEEERLLAQVSTGTTTCCFFCKKRQVTVQSSTFAEGCFFFHAVVAASTTALAAACSLSAAHTIDATWSLLSTSQTYIFRQTRKIKLIILIRNIKRSKMHLTLEHEKIEISFKWLLPHQLQEWWIGHWKLHGDSRCWGWQ